MPSKAETKRMGREVGNWIKDTGGTIDDWLKHERARQVKAHAKNAADAINWSRETGIPAVKKGAEWTADKAVDAAKWTADKAVDAAEWTTDTGIPWVGDRYDDVQDWSYKNLHDPKKHKKGEHMAYMQQQRNDAHNAMVKKHGPDYREKQLRKMGSDVYDAGADAYNWVSDQAGDVVDFTTGFAGSAYDAANAPENLANLDIDNSTKKKVAKPKKYGL